MTERHRTEVFVVDTFGLQCPELGDLDAVHTVAGALHRLVGEAAHLRAALVAALLEPGRGGGGAGTVLGHRDQVVDLVGAQPFDRRGQVAAVEGLRLARALHEVQQGDLREPAEGGGQNGAEAPMADLLFLDRVQRRRAPKIFTKTELAAASPVPS